MLTKQEIRQLGPREMMDELQRTRRELLKTQFDVRNGTSKEAHVVKNLRRHIARLQTIAKEMKLEMKSTMSKAEAGSVQSAEKKPAAETVKKTSAPKKAAAKAPAAKAKPAKAAKSAKK